jgi:hypothetical protein
MKPVKVSIILIAGLAACSALYAWSEWAAQRPAPSKQPLSETKVEKLRTKTGATAAAGGATSKTRSVSNDYKRSFAESHNYWDYANKILPAAKNGDSDAQFYLSRLLERCDEDNRMYFQRGGQKLPLDEGLRFAVKRHLSIEVAQSVFDRCHEFQENDLAQLGSAADWLAKATAAGQPLAEATTASKILTQSMLQNFARAGGVPNPSGMAKIESGVDPRKLLRAAVESKDPEVLFSIGEEQGVLNPSNSDTVTMQFAWWLVACQRGLDCSENANWVKNSCGDDAQCASAGGPEDRVRTLAGDKWPEVQQRAREIDAKLDAGQWGALGLGS